MTSVRLFALCSLRGETEGRRGRWTDAAIKYIISLLHDAVFQKTQFFFDYFLKLTNCTLGPPKYLAQRPTNFEKF